MAQAAPKHPRSPAPGGWIYSTRLHLVMYSVLLVATPFVMLMAFMQQAVGQLTRFTFNLGGLALPTFPTIVAVALVIALVLNRKHLTRRRVAAVLIAVGLIALAQQITDLYFDHHFYDVQQNWHYVAYGLFAFMVYRDLSWRGHSLARIILTTFALATLYSSFDEGFQERLSSRIFDLSDIAKDAIGCVLGMCVLYLGENPFGALLSRWRPLRHPRLGGYFRHPASALLLAAALAFSFLNFSSILSDAAYWYFIVLFTIVAWALFFFILHLSQFLWGKRLLLALLAAVLVVQGAFVVRDRGEDFTRVRPGLVVYKGVAVPFFDLLIYPSGRPRLVDKKKFFNTRDRAFLLKQKADIVVVGSGFDESGGRGFPEEGAVQFNFNVNLERGTQVIIQRNDEACRTFNRLKREGKNVLCVIHQEI